VSEYLTASGSVAAHFEYDPFGNTTINTDATNQFSYKFSTKPQDVETGLYYYGYRYYDAISGRWMNRDSIMEKDGFNLYCLLKNTPLGQCDILGLSGYIDSGPFYRHWLGGSGNDFHVDFFDYAPKWGALDFSEYRKAQSEICSRNIGEVINVDQIMTYDTNAGPGQVNVRLRGKYSKRIVPNGKCIWHFVGQITIDNDTYDFDKKDYGQRDGGGSLLFPKERATRIGGIPPGSSFETVFDGSKNQDAYGECY
jgi:RHS repeat-associated protein